MSSTPQDKKVETAKKDVFLIRPVKSLKEVEDIHIENAKIEGWGPAPYDATVFYNLDKQGFYIGELNGKPITCISVVNWSDTYSFVGFYVCQKDFRGKGYGL